MSTNQTLCAAFSTANDEDAGGSAFTWKRCLIVEVPGPWESQVFRSRHFPSGVWKAVTAADGTETEAKLQCILPDDDYSAQGRTRVILYSRPQGPFSTFNKEEYLVPTESAAPLVEQLVSNSPDTGPFERFREDTSDTRDIFICTHGSHDPCCGTLGYPVYDRLRNDYAHRPGSDLRVFRVSHLGGHRFAPNLVDMPEGRNWVRMGVDDLDALLFRTLPPSKLRPFHRGWIGLDTPQEQHVEQEALMREGWEWTGRARSGTLLEAGANGKPAKVRVAFGDGAYEATVVQIEEAPRMECTTGEQSGSWWQFQITSLERTPSA